MLKYEIDINWPLEGVSVLIKSNRFKSFLNVLGQRPTFSFDESDFWTHENVDVEMHCRRLNNIEIRDCGEEADCVDLVFPCGSIIGYVNKKEFNIIHKMKEIDQKKPYSDYSPYQLEFSFGKNY